MSPFAGASVDIVDEIRVQGSVRDDVFHFGCGSLRQAIVVITDGDDQHSRITLDQLIALLQSSRAQRG